MNKMLLCFLLCLYHYPPYYICVFFCYCSVFLFFCYSTQSQYFCECTAGTVKFSVALISTVNTQVQWNSKSA